VPRRRPRGRGCDLSGSAAAVHLLRPTAQTGSGGTLWPTAAQQRQPAAAWLGAELPHVLSARGLVWLSGGGDRRDRKAGAERRRGESPAVAPPN
jgi:hypothetical protein